MTPIQSKRAGKFDIEPGREVYGELNLAGQATSLYLRDEASFSIRGDGHRCITGVLHDLTKVTLVDCTSAGPGHAIRSKEQYTFEEVLPHYVVLGDRHIDPTDQSISGVHFVIGDAADLFYDFDAFGYVLDAQPFIDEIAHANSLDRGVEVGPNPKILYFTGKSEVLSFDTDTGRISVNHNPQHNLGGPHGVWLRNTIVVTIAFTKPVTFSDMTFHTYTLVRHLGLLVGRPQSLERLSLSIASDTTRATPLDVHASLWPTHSASRSDRKPHPSDLLIDAVRNRCRVLVEWLSRWASWSDARGRFFDCFERQMDYDIDRLVASANMFDLLPPAAVPGTTELSEGLRKARDSARKEFKALPWSEDRDGILGALGRIGKSSLKSKIEHRATLLPETVRSRLPRLLAVVREGVRCRNHYVHGIEARFDYNKQFDAMPFFTDTFEFIFAASDLVEAGWDMSAWAETCTGMFHPFARYQARYKERLQTLDSLIPPQEMP
ncbi:MAG TPA: HEPN domain-containing protein [Acetobacteraceae bacterium]|nr:HEPN domain-containing protein [Acetobacteraceae bacterium]